MGLAKNLRLMIVNICNRNRKIVALVTIVVMLVYQMVEKFNTKVVDEKPKEPFNMLQARSTYSNPIYEKIDLAFTEELSLQEICSVYFDELSKVNPGEPGAEILDLEFIQSFDFDKTIYQRETWFKQAKRKLKKELRRQHDRYNSEKEWMIWEQFDKEVSALSEYESRVVQEFSHKRIFGKCYLSRDDQLNEKEASVCNNFQKKLYPWLKINGSPSFENWRREKLNVGDVPTFVDKSPASSIEESAKCHLSDWKYKSNGKGIVIPILSEISKTKQIANILRLIKVIRVLKNTLPIQIVYLGNSLSGSDKKKIVHEARTERGRLPDSFNDYLRLTDNEHPFTSKKDYPKQEIWFVDIKDVLNKYQHPLVAKSHQFNSASFMLSLASIFNSFEEFVMLSYQAIPLVDDFANHLLNNENYKKHGQYFYKAPFRQKSLRKRHRSGFDEVNDLVKTYLMPSKLDSKYLGLKRRNSESATNLVFKQKVSSMLDLNLFAINKSKHMLGLLLSCNLQIYKILDARFEVPIGSLFGDFLWMGIEVSGVSSKLHFNNHFGAAAGVLTPLENRPYDILTTSHELCTSSWAQVSEDDDYTLMFTTSHQLENWEEEEQFRNDIRDKYTTKLVATKGDLAIIRPHNQENGEGESDGEITLNQEEITQLEDLLIRKKNDEKKDDEQKEQGGSNDNNSIKDGETNTQDPKHEGSDDQNNQQLAVSSDNDENSSPNVLKRDDNEQQDISPSVNGEVSSENKDKIEGQNNDPSKNDGKSGLDLPKLVIDENNNQPAAANENSVGDNVPVNEAPNEPENKENNQDNESKIEDNKEVEVKNDQLFKDTFLKNPGFIEATLRPPLLILPVYDPDYKEPKYGWLQFERFGGYRGHGYWCAYDTVGSPYSDHRGVITEYGKTQQTRFNYILDVWTQSDIEN